MRTNSAGHDELPADDLSFRAGNLVEDSGMFEPVDRLVARVAFVEVVPNGAGTSCEFGEPHFRLIPVQPVI